MDDSCGNLHAAGSRNATQTDINVAYNVKLTADWKSVALKGVNSFLLDFLSQGVIISPLSVMTVWFVVEKNLIDWRIQV